jgi:hypothetical protein
MSELHLAVLECRARNEDAGQAKEKGREERSEMTEENSQLAGLGEKIDNLMLVMARLAEAIDKLRKTISEDMELRKSGQSR